jgi:hypothetical protein
MYIIYSFDLNVTNLKDYNRIKRKFYYNLQKMPKEWLTKSVILCSKNKEKDFDLFFHTYKDFIKLYKIKAKTICKIY